MGQRIRIWDCFGPGQKQLCAFNNRLLDPRINNPLKNNKKQYSTVQIRIRECSSIGQNWNSDAKDRTMQTNNQNTRLCLSVWLCACLCLCAFNNRLLDRKNNNQQKPKTVQYRSESENVQAKDRIGVLKPRTKLCKQIIRIQDCVRVCGFVCVYVCVPLTIDYWTKNNNQQKPKTVQYSTDQSQRMFKPRTELEY